MMSDRFDRLLDATLESGAVPGDATESEREELLAMLATTGVFRAIAAEVDDESQAAQPIARARFERFLIDQRQPLAVPRAPITARLRPGFLEPLFGSGARRLAFAGVAAAALVVGAGFVGSQVLFSDVQTAAAQALDEGDYVQLQGVVTSTSGSGDSQRLTVSSVDFGDLEVDVSSATAVVNDQGSGDAGTLRPGSAIAIAGVVGKGDRIAARTLAVAAAPQEKPTRITFKQLRELRPNLSGKVSTLTLNQDGTKGRIILESVTGERFLVNVDGQSAQKLLELTNALGARVNVLREAGANLFGLSLAEPGTGQGAPSTPGTRPPANRPTVAPAISGLRGVVTAREGNVLSVNTPRGQLQVAVTAQTRILLGDTGLVRERILSGETSVVGHTITVTGGLDKATGQVIADVLILGPKGAR